MSAVHAKVRLVTAVSASVTLAVTSSGWPRSPMFGGCEACRPWATSDEITGARFRSFMDTATVVDVVSETDVVDR